MRHFGTARRLDAVLKPQNDISRPRSHDAIYPDRHKMLWSAQQRRLAASPSPVPFCADGRNLVPSVDQRTISRPTAPQDHPACSWLRPAPASALSLSLSRPLPPPKAWLCYHGGGKGQDKRPTLRPRPGPALRESAGLGASCVSPSRALRGSARPVAAPVAPALAVARARAAACAPCRPCLPVMDASHL